MKNVSSQVLSPSEEKKLFSRLIRHESKYVFDRHFYIFNQDNIPDTKVIICWVCKVFLMFDAS